MNCIEAAFIVIAAVGFSNSWVSAEESDTDIVIRSGYDIERFRIRMSDYSYAETTGSLRIGVRQGGAGCETVDETVVRPRATHLYEVSDKSRFGSCNNSKFNPLSDVLLILPIQIRVLSNTFNNAYFDKVGVKIGGKWLEWEGDMIMVDFNDPTDWRTAYESGFSGGELIQGFAVNMSSPYHASTYGNLRIGVRQGPHTSCETATDLIVAPKHDRRYESMDKAKFGTCLDTQFKPSDSNEIQIRVLSNSGNNAYIDRVQVKFGGKWIGWSGSRVMVDHGDPTDWRNAT